MAQVNNKRIFKNTAYLYVRMLLGLIVSLITASVILDALGVVDYGLNDVVGGMVSLFSFIGVTLSTSTSRFFSYSIGECDERKITIIFRTATYIHLIMAIIVVVLGETLGLYLVNNVLDIPNDRLFACNILWQTVIVGAFISFLQAPLGSLIISYERMNVYAYVGLFDIFARLAIVYLVRYSPYDHLITLAILNLSISISDYIIYSLYCRKQFPTISKLSLKYNKESLSKMLGFTGWSVIGSLANMLRHSGLNVLLNLFFGPVANAANAIAFRVNNAIMGFTGNFSTAVNPQITKSYAAGEFESMKNLIFRSGKMTYYMLLLLCLPVIFECKYIIHLWLGESVPKDTFILTRLVLVISMVETYTHSMGFAVQATGKIKKYQLVISGIMLAIFPLSWVLFRIGLPIYVGLLVYLACALIALFVRLYFLDTLLNIHPVNYISSVFLKTIPVTIISLIFPLILVNFMDNSGFRCILIILLGNIITCLSIWFIGADESERVFFKNLLKITFLNKK